MSQLELIPTDPYYLLDTNVIIDLARRSFPAAKYPALHKDLEKLISDGRVKSVREVYKELEEGKTTKPDLPLEWCRSHESIFLAPDDGDDEQMAIVVSHFEHEIAKSIRPYADPYLVAHALSHKCVIITDESSTPNLNVPKIPEVCAKIGADYDDIWKFFRKTGLIKYIESREGALKR